MLPSACFWWCMVRQVCCTYCLLFDFCCVVCLHLACLTMRRVQRAYCSSMPFPMYWRLWYMMKWLSSYARDKPSLCVVILSNNLWYSLLYCGRSLCWKCKARKSLIFACTSTPVGGLPSCDTVAAIRTEQMWMWWTRTCWLLLIISRFMRSYRMLLHVQHFSLRLSSHFALCWTHHSRSASGILLKLPRTCKASRSRRGATVWAMAWRQSRGSLRSEYQNLWHHVAPIKAWCLSYADTTKHIVVDSRYSRAKCLCIKIELFTLI